MNDIVFAGILIAFGILVYIWLYLASSIYLGNRAINYFNTLQQDGYYLWCLKLLYIIIYSPLLPVIVGILIVIERICIPFCKLLTNDSPFGDNLRDSLSQNDQV